MRVIWDPRQAEANLLKHGIRFSDAEGVFFDPDALTREDPASRGEHRFVSLGLDHMGRHLVVVFTYRGEALRLISARRATRTERLEYEEGIQL